MITLRTRSFCQLSSWMVVIIAAVLSRPDDKVESSTSANSVTTKKPSTIAVDRVANSESTSSGSRQKHDSSSSAFNAPTTDDFYQLVVNNTAFVDKSLLIRDYLIGTSFRTCLFAQPRGYGKSINLDMLRRFLDIEVDDTGERLAAEKSVNRKLFVGGNVEVDGKTKTLKPLKIAEDEMAMAYQGKYPVIYMSFAGITGTSYVDIVEEVGRKVYELLSRFEYVLRKAKIDPLFKNAFAFETEHGKVYLEHSLFNLSCLLYEHFGGTKVFIFIDEYDTPIMNSFLTFGNDHKDYQRVKGFVQRMLDNCYKDTFKLERGIMAGILPIRDRNLGSAIVNDYLVTNARFSRYFGFNRREVEELLKKTSITADMRRIKNWYYGFDFHGEEIYNPRSIMQFLAEAATISSTSDDRKPAEYRQHWTESGEKWFILRTLSDDDIQEDLQWLVAGEHLPTAFRDDIDFKSINRRELMLQVLSFCGYLMPTVDKPSASGVKQRLHDAAIPNNEVEYVYKSGITRWICDALNVSIAEHSNLVRLLTRCKTDEFRARLTRLLAAAVNFNDTRRSSIELFYRGFMISLTHPLSTRYANVDLNYAGNQKDVMTLIPTSSEYTTAIVSSYKIVENTDELQSTVDGVFKKISKKSLHADRLRRVPWLKKIVRIAMAFCGKNATFAHIIDDVPVKMI